ncbi:4151_t:CDS:2, partial [Dentiscutata heterogama]
MPSLTSLIDENYLQKNCEDLYNALITLLFPKNSEETENISIKEIVLPFFDDILYNITIWGIPLFVSFVYNDMLNIPKNLIITTTSLTQIILCSLPEILFDKDESISEDITSSQLTLPNEQDFDYNLLALTDHEYLTILKDRPMLTKKYENIPQIIIQ